MENLHENLSNLAQLKLEFLEKLFPTAKFSLDDDCVISSNLVVLYPPKLREISDSPLCMCVFISQRNGSFLFC